MTKSAAFTIPGTEAIGSAYAEMRNLGVTPLVARDWLIEQVADAARADIAQQVERNYAAPAEDSMITDDQLVRREIDRALNIAVAVYNRQRGRVTALDHIASEKGAAAINRAAVTRQIRTNDTARAILLEPRVDTIQTTKTQTVHYVVAVLRIGTRARAISARLTSGSKKGVWPAAVISDGGPS